MHIIPIDTDHEVAALLETLQVLKRGGVVVVPTDTVYGLIADAMNERAIERIFTVKMRSKDKPLGVFVADFQMMDAVAVADERTKELIGRFGSVTAVLPARGWMPMPLRAERGLTIGVRIPNHVFVQRLIQSFGGPLAQTSANISGRDAHTDSKKVADDFEGGEEPDLMVDAGTLPEQVPSAVVDFTKTPPRILRTGPIPKDVLMEILLRQT